MQSVLAVIIGVGRRRRIAEAAVERLARSVQYLVLSDITWRRFMHAYPDPNYLKLHIFELVDAESVALYDLDAVNLSNWSPHVYEGRREIVNLVSSSAQRQAEPSSEIDYPELRSGLLIVNRTNHERTMRLAQQLFDPLANVNHGELSLIRDSCRMLRVPLLNLCEAFQGTQSTSATNALLKYNMLTPENAPREADRFLANVPPYPADVYAGRGIVTCAGGMKYLTSAWVLIKLLRHVGCRLPIEVWYLGEEEYDASWEELARKYDVQCVDAAQVALRHPHRQLTGWESKPYAILHSRFRETLFLDADNVPIHDPTYLFDAPDYQRTGALFWPEEAEHTTPASSLRWQIFGVDYRPEPEQESGQLLIDKEKCWRALNLCNWYNENSDFYYQHVYGDKDTFRFAWHRAGVEYAMAPPPIVIPYTYVQMDFTGQPLFQHRCGAKWSLLRNIRIDGFVHEAICLRALAELCHDWRPSAQAIQRATAIHPSELADQYFELSIGGEPWGHMRLNSDGSIGPIVDWICATWSANAGRVTLHDYRGDVLAHLREENRGEWIGRRAGQRTNIVRLRLIGMIAVTDPKPSLSIP